MQTVLKEQKVTTEPNKACPPNLIPDVKINIDLKKQVEPWLSTRGSNFQNNAKPVPSRSNYVHKSREKPSKHHLYKQVTAMGAEKNYSHWNPL